MSVAGWEAQGRRSRLKKVRCFCYDYFMADLVALWVAKILLSTTMQDIGSETLNYRPGIFVKGFFVDGIL